MDKLKPCPFCGNEPTLYQDETTGHWAVRCVKDTHRPTVVNSHGATAWCYSCTDPAEAVQAWNIRKPMQNIEAYARIAVQEEERTCKNVYEGSDIDRYMMFKCSNCGCVLANHYYPKGWIEQELTDDEFFAYDGERLNYCPNCGAKVVE